MKNLLVIALVSIVLFGVAAGLTVWLQVNGAKSADTAHADDKKKKPADGHGDSKPTDKGHDDSKGEAKPTDPKAAGKDADRVEYRRLQMEVAAADLGGQMKEYDTLLKRVTVEMKVLLAEQAQIDAKSVEVKQAEDRKAKTAADDIKKGQSQAEDAERDNLTRIAGLFDQMPPEDAAGQIQAWADGGKTDTAVRVIALMKPTKATKMLTAVTDRTAKEAIFDRMKTLKLTLPGP